MVGFYELLDDVEVIVRVGVKLKIFHRHLPTFEVSLGIVGQDVGLIAYVETDVVVDLETAHERDYGVV